MTCEHLYDKGWRLSGNSEVLRYYPYGTNSELEFLADLFRGRLRVWESTTEDLKGSYCLTLYVQELRHPAPEECVLFELEFGLPFPPLNLYKKWLDSN